MLLNYFIFSLRISSRVFVWLLDVADNLQHVASREGDEGCRLPVLHALQVLPLYEFSSCNSC